MINFIAFVNLERLQIAHLIVKAHTPVVKSFENDKGHKYVSSSSCNTVTAMQKGRCMAADLSLIDLDSVIQRRNPCASTIKFTGRIQGNIE